MGAIKNPVVRKTGLVVQNLKGEVLIYDLEINKAYCLNETSVLVYELCDGNNSVSDISEQLSRKLKQPVTEDFVWLALDQFKQDNLLENSGELKINLNGLSRREAIRKAGLATIIALPVISSLIAPTAAMAQSGAVGGTAANCAACTADSDCASGNCATNSGICASGPFSETANPPNTLLAAADSESCSISGFFQCCNGSSTFIGGVCRCA